MIMMLRMMITRMLIVDENDIFAGYLQVLCLIIFF